MTKRLRVNIPGREYDICVGKGILSDTRALVQDVYSGEKAAIITDSNVGPLYAAAVASAFGKSTVITVPAGEQSKSPACLQYVYDKLLEFEITRKDLIVALGGGVVGDLTGYAAATLLRGIPFIQIPTTLLAQVDSSVGGKVAVNLPQGKNLVGVFNQPKLVITDTNTLKTLTPRVRADGMAEVIKHGAILDAGLFELLESKLEAVYGDADGVKNAYLGDIIYRCCDIKRGIVEQDEFDTGKRMILNFGHTFGHAVEKLYNFETYTHGEAVAIGMVMACELGERLGVTKHGTAIRVKSLLEAFKLPVSADVNAGELAKAMFMDKKREGSGVSFILLNEIGSCTIVKLKPEDVI